MPAVDAVHLREKARRRPDQIRAGGLHCLASGPQRRGCALACAAGAFLLWEAEDDTHEPPEWGIAQFLTVVDFTLVKTLVIVFRGSRDHVMVGLIRLQYHLPA